MLKMSRLFEMPFARVYPLYVNKVERKGRSKEQLDEIIGWLTGFDEAALAEQIAGQTTFREFFEQAHLNPNADKITGMICGIRVEQIDDPLLQKIRYLDKVVDELAQGKAMEKILRT